MVLTWKELIEKANKAGIKDTDEINYIDIDGFEYFEFFFDDEPYNDGSPKQRRVKVH